MASGLLIMDWLQWGICISLMSDVMMADLFYGKWLIDYGLAAIGQVLEEHLL